MQFPGPAALGRGVIVSAEAVAPEPFSTAPRFVIDQAVLVDPAAMVEKLHQAWATREAVVIELAVDAAALRKPEVEMDEPWKIDPSFEFSRERLQFLVWANNWDAREGEPVWWWARKAQRLLGSRIGLSEVADLQIDGVDVWCDGGPRQFILPDLTGGYDLMHRDSIELGSGNREGFVAPSSELAPDQMAAVVHDVGPARIIAPAGSGKTRVLTERLRHLVEDRNWEPNSMLVLAYNKRAADEMIERTPGLNANVRTLNSLGLAICNGTGGFARPEGRPFRNVIEEVEIRRMLDSLVDVRRMANTDPYAPFIEGLRAIRLALVDPSVIETSLEVPGLASVFSKLLDQMDERGVIDFDGQLYEAIRILLTDPVARARAQSIGRHLLVDEFQDLTPAHLLLIRLIAAPGYDVFGVGDDDQVIYGFGGASPEFLIKFDQYFPGAKHHELGVNYRCTPSVVTAASNLLTHNARRVPKHIRPREGLAPQPDELETVGIQATKAAPFTLDTIRKWNEEGVAFTDMAVLSRVNATLLPVQVLFTEAGVPCRAPLTEQILDRTGIKAAFAYMRMAMSPDAISRRDIQETIRRPSRRIASNVVDMLTKKSQISVTGIRRVANYLTGDDANRLLDYASDIELVTQASIGGDTAKVLHTIRVNVGLGDAMDKLDSSRREADRSTHGDDLIALEQVAALHEDPASFEAWLRQTLRKRPNGEGVELSTIHRVKGREWPNVVVYGVDEGLLPHRLASDLGEERRLLHVAITRASDRCVVLSDAANRSMFLGEMEKAGKPRAEEPPKKASAPARDVTPRVKDDLPELSEDEQGLYDALAKWRTAKAKEEGMPAYIILGNAALRALARDMPLDQRSLARVKGMGPAKIEKYGDGILSVLTSN